MKIFQREQRSLFGEILDWMLTPLLLLWPVSLALTWLVAQGIASQPFDRGLEYNAQALAHDLAVMDRSLSAQHGTALAQQRLRPLMRAVDVFGFHLATVDLRQSSDQHERVVAELLATAGIEAHYAGLSEADKQAVLLRLLNDARPLRVLQAQYSDHAVHELAIFETARQMRERYGAQAIVHNIISHTESVSDLLEVLLLQMVLQAWLCLLHISVHLLVL